MNNQDKRVVKVTDTLSEVFKTRTVSHHSNKIEQNNVTQV